VFIQHKIALFWQIFYKITSHPYICLDVESFPLDSQEDPSGFNDEDVLELHISNNEGDEYYIKSLPMPPRQTIKKERETWSTSSNVEFSASNHLRIQCCTTVFGRLCKNLGTKASYCLCWSEAATFILMYLKTLEDVDQVSSSQFLVKSLSDFKTALCYEVCFENDSGMPSCQCLDWINNHFSHNTSF
jgi:hypothetical protein